MNFIQIIRNKQFSTLFQGPRNSVINVHYQHFDISFTPNCADGLEIKYFGIGTKGPL